MEKADKIFEAALSLFTTKGFHGTPTSEIAKTAGVANGTLFHYFKTKEVLINNLYLNVKNEMVEESTRGIEKIESLKLKLEYLWSKTIHWAMTNPQKIFFIQQYMYSPYITSNTQEEVDKIKEVYTDLIQEGINNHEIKEIPVELIYNIATQQLFGMIQYLVVNPEKYHDSEFMNIAFNLFYDILKKN
jgi:AcrR family transcriptional regulator